MILGGLNEGVWPALPAPDPWLAPAVRRALGLPALERRIGLSAHDLVSALGAKSVLLTRAKRDARASTVPSRFWLRLDAFTGGLPKPKIDFAKLAHDLDQPAQAPNFGQRPAPQVLAALRPRRIRVTQVDSLNADPYAFYASAILNLNRLDGVEAEPGPAWRGSLIHTALERWAKDDDYRPDRVAAQVAAAFASKALHPLLTTLWEPRFTQVAERFAAIVTANRDQGRTPIAAEVPGEVELGGVLLRGKLDRVDQTEGGALAILDYKTGDPPKPEQLEQGYAMQLGLIGLMAQRGAFPGVTGTPVAFEYWSLARDRADKKHGYVRSTLTKGQTPDDYLRLTEERFISAAGRWLTGTEPFYAKRAPEFAYSDFDHLMRLEEWAGRDA
jgi:ATP-dependent helicase/nuclease subunit B